jgi:DNA-binding NtrC family response regulator
MVSAYGDIDAVLDSAESGALMFLHKKEFSAELLARMVEAVLQQARIKRHSAALESRVPSKDTVCFAGKNPAIRRAMESIVRAADNPNCVVLISGEHGTGHELAAQMIHDRSRTRSDGPMVTATDLSALIEDSRAKLFGSPVRSGTPRRKGLMEQANGGVLFLDRVEELDPGVRLSLCEALGLRALDIGLPGMKVPIDLQFIAGSASEETDTLTAELENVAGSQHVVEIYLPPLRERREDIPLLTAFYLQELRQTGRATVRAISRDALGELELHTWPGNLPELRNAVEFGAIRALVAGNDELLPEHLPANLLHFGLTDHINECWDYHYHMARSEVALAERALEQRSDLNKKQLAEFLSYTDRFAFSRRMRTAFRDFPVLGREFPRVGGMFRTVA